ncbi:MAG: lysophospholipid acyltransferase family protein [Rhodocyclaceae bacterium]|nr:lysophospholipid acyltransferase family protein [Pseudomonadota bacterium]MDQ7973756.1 lysophospholipid acyltransferase family protein [Rhodocyclaceae bacterium]MDQ7998322.1 lysophospholipid acyltransferase family protein [Pseudomonadota bacterium]
MNDVLDSDAPPPRVIVRRVLAFIAGRLIIGIAALLTGVRAIWSGTAPRAEQTLYFANHTSHGDFVLLWATLPPDLRAITRPVAGQDYWMASKLRRFIGEDVFNALMIRRDGGSDGPNPVQQMTDALKAGDSLIMFPEGTRNTGEDILLPLKSGLFHIARYLQQEGLPVRLVPVWIENLKRVLPKGQLVPVPLACSVRFGAPLALGDGEDKAAFLARARQAMLDLRPEYDRADDTDAPQPAVAVQPAAGTEGAP